MVELNFDVEEVTPNDFSPLPAGNYAGEILAADVTKTSKGHDTLLLTIQVNGRRVRDYLNLWNPNNKAVEIAEERLSQIGNALGMSKIADTDHLLAKSLTVKLGIQEGGQYNEVLGYSAATDSPPPAAAPPVAAPAPTAPAASAPWEQ